MELYIGIAITAFSLGAIFGIVIVGRHYALENEKAYLTGHVDGYNRAMFDAGEVPL